MKVLVTGCAGFLGGHLCKELLRQGHEVFGIDNLLTGFRHNVPPEVNFRVANVVDCVFTEEEEEGVQLCFHLACPASPKNYQKDKTETLRTCVLGTLNILQFCRRKQGRGLLFTSTSEIYGSPLCSPQCETLWSHLHTTGPRSCYDVGKAAAETAVNDFQGVPRVIVRLFNCYGPALSATDGRVISNLIMQALHNEPMTVYGTGSQTRSFCYVSDMIQGLIAASRHVSVADPQVINLGNPDERTILDVAHLVRSLTSSTSEIQFLDLPIDDPVRRCPDIQKAQTLLGWTPTVSFRDGLQHTIDFFRRSSGLLLLHGPQTLDEDHKHP